MPDLGAMAAAAMKGELDDDDEEEEEEDEDANEQGAAGGDKNQDAVVSADADMKTASVSDTELLAILHTLLLDTHVTEGELVCGGCKRHYKIQQGIPNMRLNEDEV